MRRFVSKQLINIVFLILVMAAALTIYLLSRAQQNATAASGNTSPAAASPSPAAASAEPVFSGVPESVFITHLKTGESFTAKQSDSGARVWTLCVDGTLPVEAELTYTVERGAVSSFVLSVPFPAEGSKKSDSAIDRYLASRSGETASICREAVRVLLSDLIPACDANDALAEASIRVWAEEATQIEKSDDSFDGRENGFAFLVYKVQRADDDYLVCEFYVEP